MDEVLFSISSLKGAFIINQVVLIKLLISIAYGVLIGIVTPVLSSRLISSRSEDPLASSKITQKNIKILYIVVGVAVSVALALTAQTIPLFIRNLLLLIPIYSISTVDALVRKIPNSLLLIMIATQAIYLTYYCIDAKNAQMLASAGFGFFFGFLVCTIPSLLKIPIGAGDVKYSAVIGLCIYMTSYVQAMVLMAILVLIFFIILKAKKKGDLKTQIPMGPFLSAGTVITMCFPLVEQFSGSMF